MKLLLIGATRGIGARLTEQALEAGHEVTVLARHPKKLTLSHENLTVIQGDVRDAQAVREAMPGQEGVALTIGIMPTLAKVTVFSEGTRNVATAMEAASVSKLVCVTGVGAGDSKGHGNFAYDKIFLPLLLRTMYEDKDRQEALLQSTDLQWVVVRPGFLTNGPLTGRYRAITNLQGVTAGKISRADVAHFMLGQLEKMTFLRQTPLLTY